MPTLDVSELNVIIAVLGMCAVHDITFECVADNI